MDRLLAATLPATVMVQPNQPGFDWDAVRRLPGVAAVGTFALGDVRVEGRPELAVGYPSADVELLQAIERPVLLAGRMPDPARPDEVLTTPEVLAQNGLRLGDTVVARLYTVAEADRAAGSDEVSPTGPRQPLRIVAVVRTPALVDTFELTTTPAFATRYRPNLLGTKGEVPFNAIVRLTDGEAGLPAFSEAFTRLTGRDDIEVANLAAAARQHDEADDFEAGVLLAFALAALAAATVLLGQAVVRYANAAVADLATLRALGMTSREAALAAAAGPGLAAVAGVLTGAAAATAVSPLFPIGSARTVEPDPGPHADLTVLAGVAAWSSC